MMTKTAFRIVTSLVMVFHHNLRVTLQARRDDEVGAQVAVGDQNITGSKMIELLPG